MVDAMAAQERDLVGRAAVFQVVEEDRDGRGRLAPGGVDVESRFLNEAWERLESGATNDRNSHRTWMHIMISRCLETALVG